MNLKRLGVVLGLIAILGMPIIASAHEVYVLTPDEVSQAITMTSPNPLTAIPEHESQFLFWGALISIGILITLAVSDARWSENKFDPLLIKLKKFAPLLGRLTFGIAFIASGYFGDFFGPELPAAHLLGMSGATVLSWILMIAGLLICLGFRTRIMAAIGLVVFAITAVNYQWYMLTYVNYLGEILLFLILGGGLWSLDHHFARKKKKKEPKWRFQLEEMSFFILRILFGFSLFFASFYAKFLHSNLALNTVSDYHLTNYFHFTPLFLVLGAFLVEVLIGACFFFGFQIRLASIVFTIFLTLSICFFGEAVWPHIILFGVNFALFAHGYDKYTVGYWLNRKVSKWRGGKLPKLMEPVL